MEKLRDGGNPLLIELTQLLVVPAKFNKENGLENFLSEWLKFELNWMCAVTFVQKCSNSDFVCDFFVSVTTTLSLVNLRARKVGSAKINRNNSAASQRL